ncbi:MAG: hypothetical protein H7Z37_00235 [Pyrinomonadaceae bacterium]|nr:hypothetical protein [Pyrinomonadaceae bacterium]
MSAAFVLLATFSQTAIAQKYVSKTDGFSIAFLGKPTIEKKNAKTVDGNLEFRIYSVKTANAFFALSVSNVPSGLDAETSRIVLQNVLNDKTGNGSVLTKKTVVTSGHNGIEADIKQSNFIKRGRYYIINDKLYQIIVAGAGNYYKSAAAMRFLNSLTFIEDSTRATSQRFVSNECGFSVDLPKTPAIEVLPLKSVPNKFVRSFTVISTNKTRMIVCVDLTPERMSDGIEATIDSFYKETITGGDIRVIEKKQLTLEGSEGIEYTAETKGLYKRGRVFIVGTQLLSISFIGTKTAVAGDDVTAYLDSFKLIKRTITTDSTSRSIK